MVQRKDRWNRCFRKIRQNHKKQAASSSVVLGQHQNDIFSRKTGTHLEVATYCCCWYNQYKCQTNLTATVQQRHGGTSVYVLLLRIVCTVSWGGCYPPSSVYHLKSFQHWPRFPIMAGRTWSTIGFPQHRQGKGGGGGSCDFFFKYSHHMLTLKNTVTYCWGVPYDT